MTTPRLGWLDALRGYAALVVVCFHLSPLILGNDRHLAVMHHLDLGKYGVLLFFLVSGYVIPLSLERHGSLRRFWIGRLCRIYPAYLATIALVGTLALAGLAPWQHSFTTQTVAAVLGHATMTTELLGLHGAVRVFWTLAYEMTFYLVVSGLYAWRQHHRSTWWAPLLALTGLLAGPALPSALLAGTFDGRRRTAIAIAVLLAASLAAYLTRRLQLAAGALGIGFLLLPALDAHPARDSTVVASWQGLQLLAVMFAGTVVYRARHNPRAATASLAVTGLAVLGAHWTYLGGGAWPLTLAAVTLTFAAAHTLRHRPVPAALSWLGRISYSVYLLHAVVLYLIPKIVPDLPQHPPLVRLAAALTYLAAVLALAALSHRIIEKPGQDLGRHLAARLHTPPTLTTQRVAPGTGREENRRQSV